MEAKDCIPGVKVKIPKTKNSTKGSDYQQFLLERQYHFPKLEFFTIIGDCGANVEIKDENTGLMYYFLPSDLELYESEENTYHRAIGIPIKGEQDFFGTQEEEELLMNGTPIEGTYWKVGDAVQTPKGYEDKVSPQFGSLFIKYGIKKSFGAELVLTSDPIHHSDEIGRFYCTDLEPYSTSSKADPIIPSHYNSTSITPFQVIDDWDLDFYLGNVVKYLCRKDKKGFPKQDLLKAQEYLTQAINRLPNE